MENPRILLSNRIKTNNTCTNDNKRWDNHLLSSLIESMYYTIMDYINFYRYDTGNNPKIMSNLEREYYLCEEFMNTDYPEEFIEINREFHETGLILYIYDNFQRIESTKHRRVMFYIMNMLFFDL